MAHLFRSSIIPWPLRPLPPHMQVVASTDTPVAHLSRSSIIPGAKADAEAEALAAASATELAARSDRARHVFAHTCGELWAFSLTDSHIISRIRCVGHARREDVVGETCRNPPG